MKKITLGRNGGNRPPQRSEGSPMSSQFTFDFESPSQTIPVGLCQCGCGRKTRICERTDRTYGWVRGMPKRFIRGHKARTAQLREAVASIFPIPDGLCQCGCGRKTFVPDYNWAPSGYVIGVPRPYIKGHKTKAESVSRFWSYFDKNDPNGCWKWTKYISKYGYGYCNFNRKRIHAHRMAWILTNGPIPNGLSVCHTCDVHYPPGDISYRNCGNPRHLFLGTKKDNSMDAATKGRIAHGERCHASKLTESDVLEIRRLVESRELNFKEIAQKFSVGERHVYSIANREAWARLD